MLLPQTIEREYRFKLALRMGLPIFLLTFALISSTFIDDYKSLSPVFYFILILFFVFSIYFLFFLIYKGFEVKITDYVSGTFTREYLYNYLLNELEKNKEYTLVLISIDNLLDINNRYGLSHGDKVIQQMITHISNFFKEKNINNYPMGHIKGSDFILGFQGKKEEYETLLDLFCIKSDEFKIDQIEVSISGAIIDTTFSRNLDHLIETLFEIQLHNKTKKTNAIKELIDPNHLDRYVVEAIKNEKINLFTQDVYENNIPAIRECFVKLHTTDNKVLHPKTYMKSLNKLGLTLQYDLLIVKKIIKEYIHENSLPVAVFISPDSVRNYAFVQTLKTMFEKHPSVKDKLILLLSETQYYTQVTKYNEVLQSIRSNGVRIAIDRIGSLHTSFLYLRELDVDIVRFDSVYKNENYKEILEGLNLLAHAKGVKTWLKLIETSDQEKFAKDIKIDYLQGKELSQLKEIDIGK